MSESFNDNEVPNSFSNGLTGQEAELLALLIEECAEVQQAATKILRHGLESTNPMVLRSVTNRETLQRELGDLEAAVVLLVQALTVDPEAIERAKAIKLDGVRRWLHHTKP